MQHFMEQGQCTYRAVNIIETSHHNYSQDVTNYSPNVSHKALWMSQGQMRWNGLEMYIQLDSITCA